MAAWQSQLRKELGRYDENYLSCSVRKLTGNMQVDVISFTYAAALAFGGLMGYWKAGSTQSLYSGVVIGGVMAYGAYQTSNDPNNVAISLVVSVVTTGLMASRYHDTGKLMPAGVVALLSALMAGRFALRLIGVKTP